jgi:hypothetical protein
MTTSPPPRDGPSRREILAGIGTGAIATLAGCDADGTGGNTAPLYDGDWHAYGNGPLNRHRVTGGAPAPEASESLTPASWPYLPPVVHESTAYFATDERVVAVGTDGTEQWSRNLGVTVSGAPALDPERSRFYVPTAGATSNESEGPPASVVVLSLADGRTVDTFQVGSERTYGVTVVDGDVYARSATTCVRVGSDGTERWRQTFEPLVYDEYNLGDSTATQIPPAVTANGVYVPDRDAVVKLTPDTGEEVWRVAVDTPYAASVVDDSGVIQTGWQETVAVDHAGDVRWRRDLHSRAAAGIGDSEIYIVANDLHELDAATGETNWQAHLPSEGTAAPVVTDSAIIVAAGDVRAFRRTADGMLAPDRLQWQDSSVHATAYSSPVVADGRIFVSGNFGLAVLHDGP